MGQEENKKSNLFKDKKTWKAKNSFYDSAREGVFTTLKENILSSGFWTPIIIFTFIAIIIGVIFGVLINPYNEGTSTLNNISVLVTILQITYYVFLVILSAVTIPYLFSKRDNDKQPNLDAKISSNNYQGLILGKYLGMIIIFVAYSSILVLIMFATLVASTGAAFLPFVSSRVLQIFVGGLLFSITWVILLTAIGTFFRKGWEASVFNAFFMTTILVFVPLQLALSNAPATQDIAMVEGNTATIHKVANYKNVNEREPDHYASIAVIDPSAYLISLFSLLDTAIIERDDALLTNTNATSLGIKYTTKDIIYSPHDYSTIYDIPADKTNDWEVSRISEYGLSGEVNSSQYVVDVVAYYYSEIMIEDYEKEDEIIQEVFNVSYPAIHNLVTQQIGADSNITGYGSTTTLLQLYNAYLSENFNPFGVAIVDRLGSYTTNPYSTPTELLQGNYLDFLDFVESVSSWANFEQTVGDNIKINNVILRQQKNILGEYYKITIDDMGDWNYYFSNILNYMDPVTYTSPFVITPTPMITTAQQDDNKNALQDGYVGVTNQILYEVEATKYFPTWGYILILLGVAGLFYWISTVVIKKRNYY